MVRKTFSIKAVCGLFNNSLFVRKLFTEPELLILDEPTVGVDPIIRNSIWDHLVEITNTRKTTVIITTHYIEETRQAHVVSIVFTWSHGSAC